MKQKSVFGGGWYKITGKCDPAQELQLPDGEKNKKSGLKSKRNENCKAGKSQLAVATSGSPDLI